MNLFITGGAGTLGSRIAEHWSEKFETIVVLDDFTTGNRDRVSKIQNVKLIGGSVTDAEAIGRILREYKPELVINSAASYKDPDDWSRDLDVNAGGSIHLVRELLNSGLGSRLINFQTALCFGRPGVDVIPQNHRLAPFTSYGISKVAGEQFILNFYPNSVSLRIANVTGPGLAIGPIPAFYKRLKAHEPITITNSVRDYLAMDDFLRLMDALVQTKTPDSSVYNVASGTGHSVREVLDEVIRVTGIEPETVNEVEVGQDDVQRVVMDPSATTQQFGWHADQALSDVVADTIAWYESEGLGEVHSHLKIK